MTPAADLSERLAPYTMRQFVVFMSGTGGYREFRFDSPALVWARLLVSGRAAFDATVQAIGAAT